jgi:tripartite-type tricarboxylate transporter receptor subunit TctC
MFHSDFLKRLGLPAILSAIAMSASAQTWPTKPVTIVVPYSPGGTTDIVARLAAQNLQAALNQTFLADNRPGASGTMAMRQVAKAAPDGYTLFANEITQTVVSELYPSLGFNPAKDLQAITLIAETPVILAVSPNVPARNLAELIAYAKANPGKINYGSGGVGSGPHIAGELLKSVAGIEMTHVPYKGSGPAVSDLMGGQIQVLISAAPTITPHVKAGKIRALAVAGNTRIPLLPDVPTAKEAGLPDFQFSIWFGIAGPKGMPTNIVNSIHTELVKALARPDVRERLVQSGADPVGAGPQEFARRIETETVKWGSLMKKAGAKAE